MSATLIKGKPIADRIRAEVATEVEGLGHIGLVTVLVGDDPASETYIRLKHKAALEAGFDATDLRLPADTREDSSNTPQVPTDKFALRFVKPA